MDIKPIYEKTDVLADIPYIAAPCFYAHFDTSFLIRQPRDEYVPPPPLAEIYAETPTAVAN